MRLYSAQTEQQLLICALETRSPKIRALILTETAVDDYGSKHGLAIRKRMNALMERGKSLVSAFDFAEDPAVASDEATAAFIKATTAKRKAARSFRLEKVKQLIDQLKTYRNTRYVHEAQEEINDIAIGKLDEGGIEKIELVMENTLSNIRSNAGIKPIAHFGKRRSDDEARKEFEDVIKFDPGNFVSTGLVGLDECIKGYERGNLVTVSAPRGGGKTTMAMVKGLNQYMKTGSNVGFVSLEMQKKELLRRIYSNLSGVEHDRIRYSKDLTKEQRSRVGEAAKNFHKHGKRADCTFSIWAPGDPLFTPTKMVSEVAPLMYDALYVDYITLFHQGNHRDTWTMQMEYSRYLKMMAQRLNCVIVLLTQLSEDERVKYGKCVAAGSHVWGTGKQIQHVQPGCNVRTHAAASNTITDAKAKRLFKNGRKKTLCICTKRREVNVTPNHHLLVQTPAGEVVWKRAADIRLHRKPSGGINYKKTDKLVICTDMGDGAEIGLEELVDVAAIRKTEHGNKGTPHQIHLPETITPWLGQLYGFMLGDGWTTEQPTNHAICFSVGTDEEINTEYEELLRKLGCNPQRYMKNDGSLSGGVHAATIQGVRLFRELGWKNGAKTKRIPEWVFRLPREHRQAFLKGFMHADGWSSQPKTWKRRAYHFEISNRALAYDIKALLDGLGYKSGRVRERKRTPGKKINGNVVKTCSTAYTLTFSSEKFDGAHTAEAVLSIEASEEPVAVYDVEVDHTDHNYVVDGVVAHNSIEENTDYWLWWRWREEEEQETGNVEIRLAKARHARGGRRIPAKFMLDVMRIETSAPQLGRAVQQVAGEMDAESKVWQQSEDNE
jgi:replicative DNA helicase